MTEMSDKAFLGFIKLIILCKLKRRKTVTSVGIGYKRVWYMESKWLIKTGICQIKDYIFLKSCGERKKLSLGVNLNIHTVNNLTIKLYHASNYSCFEIRESLFLQEIKIVFFFIWWWCFKIYSIQIKEKLQSQFIYKTLFFLSHLYISSHGIFQCTMHCIFW